MHYSWINYAIMLADNLWYQGEKYNRDMQRPNFLGVENF